MTKLPMPLTDDQWLVLLRAIVFIGFGVLAFFWRGPTLVTLTLLWGAHALIDGVIALWAAVKASEGETGPRFWLGLSGVMSILTAIATFYCSGQTTMVLLMYERFWPRPVLRQRGEATWTAYAAALKWVPLSARQTVLTNQLLALVHLGF
ncbi:DUF308 domain-containing protein [Bradyrhizobium sp. Pear77]|uniref:HdeD family acid-resistance protein n=1 Tax=Bradyrhizobium altum TaxID=1571202 RepID=UPI001E2F27B1|nr:DUF308 domain-containing protein [Bradyrhizobium altum]MCC8958352.1 DUF308 domain-containing protein [Bradyrhizobium altum]